MRDLQGEQLARISFAEFLVGQPLMIGPVQLILAVAGAAALVAWKSWRAFAVVGWTCILAFALLFVMRGKPYYIGPIYPALFAAGSVLLERTSGLRFATASRVLAVSAMFALGALALPLAVPLWSREFTSDYAFRTGATASLRTNRGGMDRLPQDFADMLGWEEQARELARVTATLSPVERTGATIFASNYGEAGAAEFYRERYSLPPVISAAGSFWFFGPGTRSGTVLITIGEDSADVAKAYDDVRVAGTVRSPWSVQEEREVTVIVARRPKRTLQELWPSLAGQN
jgi:hypothetical protein